MLNKFIKRTASKIARSGFFKITHIAATELSFTDGSLVYSCQKRGPFYLFRAGYVLTGKAYKPTYESDYRHLGWIDVAEFRPILEQSTDNPAFVLRQSLALNSPDF